MLDLSKHDCHVIASVYTGDNRFGDIGQHINTRHVLDDMCASYQIVEGSYTHTNGKTVRELAFVMPREVWDSLRAGPYGGVFDSQESILMVFGRTYHTASLVYLEDEDGEVASPIHFKAFHSVDREYALEQPCYTRHGDTYYVAE